MGNTRVDGTAIRLTCGSLAKTFELIRSLRDDEQVKSQEPGMRKWLRVTMRANGRSKTSLIFRFRVPNEEPASRSLKRMFPLLLCVVVCCGVFVIVCDCL